MLSSKVAGTIYLDKWADELNLKLDMFVVFSSIYGLLGYAMLAHYAAANYFQDGITAIRRAKGKPSLCVNWGLWQDDGMAHRLGDGFNKQWQQQGFGTIPPNDGMGTLCRLLALQ